MPYPEIPGLREWLVTEPDHRQLEPTAVYFFVVAIYERPADQPDKFVVRAFANPVDHSNAKERFLPCRGVLCDTLEEARAVVPPWLTLARRNPRTPLDAIIEEYV